MRSLLELMEEHAAIGEKLAVHRDFVVGLEWGRAVEALEEFERGLRRHMEDEERHILPLYEARVGHVLGGDPEFFHLEHRNLLKFLATILEKSRALAADPGAGRRQAHVLLNEEAMLLHLLDHHSRRERNTLYPELDRKLSDCEREAILVSCGR